MLRKTIMALATTAALAFAVAPTGASARGVGGHVGMGHVGMGHVGVGHVGGWGRVGGFGHPGFGRFGFHRGFHRFGFRRGFFVGGPWIGSCWRLVAGPFGWHRVWVCGYRPYAWR